MANEEKTRHWYAVTRIQGLFITAAGIGMLFHPVTAPYAGQVIAAGLGWAAGGINAKLTRKVPEKSLDK